MKGLNSDGTLAPVTDVTTLVNELIHHVSSLDNLFEQKVSYSDPALGLQVFPGVTLTLEYLFIRHPDEKFNAEYDHFIVLLPDFLAIRGIRYSGQRTLSSTASFIIYELLRQKRGASIGEELLGSFVTKGKVQNIALIDHQIAISPLLALIRPLFKDRFIVPSPLSYITHTILLKGVQHKKYFLSPFTLMIILRELKFKKEFRVLGTTLSGFFTKNASVLIYDPLNEVLRETSIPVFLIKGLDRAFDEYYESLKMRKVIVTQLLGMFIFGNGLPIAYTGATTYNCLFIAFSRSYPYIELEALAIYGKPQSLVPSTTSSRQCYYYNLCAEIEHVEKFVNSVETRVLNIEHHMWKSDTSILSQEVEDFIKKKLLPQIIIEDDSKICMLAPPLISLLLSSNISGNNMWSYLKRLKDTALQGKLLFYLEIVKLKQEKTWRSLALRKIGSPWNRALQAQQEYVKKHKLWYIV